MLVAPFLIACVIDLCIRKNAGVYACVCALPQASAISLQPLLLPIRARRGRWEIVEDTRSGIDRSLVKFALNVTFSQLSVLSFWWKRKLNRRVVEWGMPQVPQAHKSRETIPFWLSCRFRHRACKVPNPLLVDKSCWFQKYAIFPMP